MAKAYFAQSNRLYGGVGRLEYTNAKNDKEKRKNEFLGSYDTTSESTEVNWKYWTELGEYNQEQFKKSINFGRTYFVQENGKEIEKEYQCIEAREYIIEIPNELYDNGYDYNKIAKYIALLFLEVFKCQCNVAVHINEDKTNLHAHVVFSERDYLKEKKVASRNLFFDENGKRRYKKSEILNEDKSLREGCKIVPKGSILEEYTFTSKDKHLKSLALNRETKQLFIDEWNTMLQKEKYKLYDKNDVYLAQKKIKNTYKKETKERLKKENEAIVAYNNQVKELVDAGYDEDELYDMKYDILDKAKLNSSNPTEYSNNLINYIHAAIEQLKEMLKQWMNSIENQIRTVRNRQKTASTGFENQTKTYKSKKDLER